MTVFRESLKSAIFRIALKCPWLNSWVHYSLRKLLDVDDIIRLFFIVGERRIGKTLFFQWLMCQLYIETGYQTMWVRNKKVELEDDGFVNGFLNACHDFGWCPDDWKCTPRGVQDGEGNDVCLFQSISTFSNRRGNRTADVLMMVFDEFMPEERRYPRDCCKGLMSLIKTVLAERPDSMCFCLSNYISGANPYFVGFQIYPEDGRDVTVFPEKGIAIEVCKGYKTAIVKENPWNNVVRAGGYQDYATNDEDKLMELVAKVPKGGEPMSWVLISDGVVYRMIRKDGIGYWTRYNGSLKGLLLYTVNREECGKGVQMAPLWVVQGLKDWFASDLMRYKDPNVMFAVLHCVFETV